MTKRQLIDEITMRNPTAKTDFLARFEEADLGAYLDHLIVARRPRLSGGGNRYAKYFVSADRMAAQAEQTFVESPRVPAPIEQPAPASPMEEPAQIENLPLERSEPEKVIQPALFSPPAADVNEAVDEPLPVTDSTGREETVLSGPASALETDSDARAAQPAEVEMQAEPAPAKEEIKELSQDQPVEDAQALACWYRGEGEPIAVTWDNHQQEQTSDGLEEMNGLPSPYGQDFHGEDVAPTGEDAPPANVDETEHNEIAADEPVEEDVPGEEPVEEPAVEAAREEPAQDDTPPARKKKRQPVAVGVEHESNNNQDSDSWLF